MRVRMIRHRGNPAVSRSMGHGAAAAIFHRYVGGWLSSKTRGRQPPPRPPRQTSCRPIHPCEHGAWPGMHVVVSSRARCHGGGRQQGHEDFVPCLVAMNETSYVGEAEPKLASTTGVEAASWLLHGRLGRGPREDAHATWRCSRVVPRGGMRGQLLWVHLALVAMPTMITGRATAFLVVVE